MSSLLPRALRLLKFGAVAGALVGVGRLVLMRRRRSDVDESSWPTIAETAAQNGQPVEDSDDAEAAPDDGDDGSETADAATGSDKDATGSDKD